MTIEERDEIVQRVLLELNSRSKSIDELEVIDDLAKTESLPTYKKDTKELVAVPIELISKPAIDAAGKVDELLETSEENMEKLAEALKTAEASIPTIEEAITNAQTATSKLEGIIVPISESEFEALEVKNPDSLYVCFEDDEPEEDLENNQET